MAVIKFNLHFYFPLSTKIIEVSLLIVTSEIIKKKPIIQINVNDTFLENVKSASRSSR